MKKKFLIGVLIIIVLGIIGGIIYVTRPINIHPISNVEYEPVLENGKLKQIDDWCLEYLNEKCSQTYLNGVDVISVVSHFYSEDMIIEIIKDGEVFEFGSYKGEGKQRVDVVTRLTIDERFQLHELVDIIGSRDRCEINLIVQDDNIVGFIVEKIDE